MKYRVPRFIGLPRESGGDALDLGLAIGALAPAYADQFRWVVAVRASSRCADVARANLDTARISNFEFIHGALDPESGEPVSLRRIYVGDAYESKDFSTVDMRNETSRGQTSLDGSVKLKR